LIGIANPFSELTTIQYDALNREKHRRNMSIPMRHSL